MSMDCPKCEHRTTVYNTGTEKMKQRDQRSIPKFIEQNYEYQLRRRKCPNCGHTFATIEIERVAFEDIALMMRC